ncbi:MAG: TonB-dependent receptor [Archangiaceae bacterium]|nr:TonB-dependent receptor [Archangiaceae bacterium]
MSRSCLPISAALLVSAVAVGDEVVPPEVISKVAAVPPVGAPPALHEHVVLELTITDDGVVHDVVVIESAGEAWDQAAVTALKQWRFKPALHQGKTVASRTQLTFNVAAPPPTPDAGLAAQPDGGELLEAPDAGQAPAPERQPPEYTTRVLGRAEPKSTAPSDFHIEVGDLRIVPRKTSTEFLKLAPGILITNEGGEGHPDQIFLRGFDAREGQDIELTAEGMPINESGNLHGNGYADLHFIIPELIENLRVVEGPFDPAQGNYAVAGSADFELGLQQKGLTAKAAAGTFDTQRLVLLWGPPGESSRSFAGVQLYRTGGFGQNRDAQYAALMGQYELPLSQSATAYIGVNGYAAKYHSAGVLRADDVEAGRVGFYDTYDNRLGGDTLRASIYGAIHHHGGPFVQQHQVFLTVRNARLTDNFTGFLLDVQGQLQNPHDQRGDALDRNSLAITVGAKGFGRYRARVLDHNHELTLGYFGRFDLAEGTQQRLIAGTNTPYRRDVDLDSKLTDVGLYANADIHPFDWLTLRGGVRADLFTFNVHDNCAVQDVRRPSSQNPPGDQSCISQMDLGKYREPDERVSALGSSIMPRGTLLLGPFAGVTLSGAAGQGVRSIDPQYVSQNIETPFASIFAWEGGAQWAHRWQSLDASARAVVFGTRVDKDLVFSEQAGRNIIGGATRRLGGLVAARARGGFFDLSLNGTYVHSAFEDTGFVVPYVPDLVLRADGAVFHALPWRLFAHDLRAQLGVGYTFVGRRALPYGQRSDVISVLDANVELTWRWLTLGVSCTNLLNTRYRLGEYNYASDFHTSGAFPTLVPQRHFSAGPPRQLLFSLAVNLGGQS